MCLPGQSRVLNWQPCLFHTISRMHTPTSAWIIKYVGGSQEKAGATMLARLSKEHICLLRVVNFDGFRPGALSDFFFWHNYSAQRSRILLTYHHGPEGEALLVSSGLILYFEYCEFVSSFGFGP
ncbi:uncharacterized protein [Lolium perenne]|uniref:uncharacterized protein isoform X2 n=1 Tax=Lolium perenne TaxID=4522 RepID=UPI003A99AE2A